MVEAVAVEEDQDHRAAVAVRVLVPDVEVTHVATPGVAQSHVDVLRAKVLLVLNHIPDPGQIRGGPTIDHVQGKYKNFNERNC